MLSAPTRFWGRGQRFLPAAQAMAWGIFLSSLAENTSSQQRFTRAQSASAARSLQSQCKIDLPRITWASTRQRQQTLFQSQAGAARVRLSILPGILEGSST